MKTPDWSVETLGRGCNFVWWLHALNYVWQYVMLDFVYGCTIVISVTCIHVRGNVHIHLATQHVILTFWVGELKC